jgi:aromatic ring-opening dioxygenase catalytic subunit (LigB family)
MATRCTRSLSAGHAGDGDGASTHDPRIRRLSERELFAVQYPAPGEPPLARRLAPLRDEELMRTRDHAPLIDYEQLGRDAMLSAPTPDHYLPLLYVLGLQQADEEVSFPVEGIDGGSISMLTVRVG